MKTTGNAFEHLSSPDGCADDCPACAEDERLELVSEVMAANDLSDELWDALNDEQQEALIREHAYCVVCADRGYLPPFRGCYGSIQRCDTCEKFPGDVDAAQAYLSSTDCHHDLHDVVLKPK